MSTQPSAKMGTGTIIAISVGAIAVIGTAAYFLFRKNTVPGSGAGGTAAVPPVIVSGWKNGNAMYSIAGTTGVLSTNGTATKAGSGPYSIQVNDWDGSGYDVTVLNGSNVVNEVYLTGNGSFSFLGKPGVGHAFLGQPGVGHGRRNHDFKGKKA